MALDCSGCVRRLLPRRQLFWQAWHRVCGDRPRPRQLGNHHRRSDRRAAQRPAAGNHVQPRDQRSEDVSHAIAQEILRRLGIDGRSVPPLLDDFMDRHVGSDRQLTLRLALT